MTHQTAVVKRNIELLLMFPLVLLGKLAGKLFKLNTQHDLFLFYRCAEIGGATKVNADIAECMKDRKPLVIFTKKGKDDKFRDRFTIEGVRVLDLHKYLDNKYLYFLNFFFRGVFAAWINAAENPVVFGGECIYFYKILPHLRKKVRTVELCHVNRWYEYSRAFIKYMDVRIASTPQVKRDLEAIYQRDHIAQHYFDRLKFVDNKIDVPSAPTINDHPVLEVVFIGRGHPQKRVHLIAATAQQLHAQQKPVHFSFVGDVENLIPAEVQEYAVLYGNVRDPKKMEEIYAQSDVLILTSAFEGLPIVVMESMARGKVVLSTAVDGIPDYVHHLGNGLLIYAKEEEKIVAEAVELLDFLVANPEKRKAMGLRAYEFAKDHFSSETFSNAYRDFLTNPGKPI
ncbi:glycosyltransferase family 4 protein [Taibaiella soli]|uniref:Uncharacterized protein n=1 Tax=Taibaiella soli TaxID=1649169 RepID=A0A2W2AD84_9BACT|nr:glycosyltransferase family 4 protein [Taibaiella soli]PZF73211.1 hypothetical protein DN068_10095 [Taibaiella soli]